MKINLTKKLTALAVLALAVLAPAAATASWDWSCCTHESAYQRVRFDIEGNGWLDVPADMRSFSAANLPEGSVLNVQWSDDGVTWFGCLHETDGHAEIVSGTPGCSACAHALITLTAETQEDVTVQTGTDDETVTVIREQEETEKTSSGTADVPEEPMDASADSGSTDRNVDGQTPEDRPLTEGTGETETGRAKERRPLFSRKAEGLRGLFTADAGYAMRIAGLYQVPSPLSVITPAKAELVTPDWLSVRLGTELLYGTGPFRIGGRTGLRLTAEPSPEAGNLAGVLGNGMETSISPYAGIVAGIEFWRIRLAVGADFGWSFLTRTDSDNAHTFGTVEVLGLPVSNAWTLGGDVSLSFWFSQKLALTASAGLVRYFPSGYAIGEVRAGVTFAL